MRLLTLACALAAVLPLSALAQTQIAPGVTYVPPTNAYNMLPNGSQAVAPGLMGAPGLGAGQVGVPNPAQVPPGQSVPSNPVSAPSTDTTASSTPPTASEQGFGAGDDLKEAKRLLADQAAMSTPRQKGIVVPAPQLSNPVGKDRASREWLSNWAWALGNVGVSQAKVDFEANRLGRSDFEAWASRQLRFRHGEHARVEVLDRPELDPSR